MVDLGVRSGLRRRRGARQRNGSLVRWTRALAILLTFVVAPLTALATYPGINGKIAYTDVVDAGSPVERRAVFIHGQGQFTHPTPRANASDRDSDPAWTPDGKLMAFVRRDGLTGQYGIFVVKEDGSELRQVFNTGQLVNGQPGILAGRPLSFLSWERTGHDILFASTLGVHWISGADVGSNLQAGAGFLYLFLANGTLEAGDHGVLNGGCNGSALRVCITSYSNGFEFFDISLPGGSPGDLGATNNRWWPKANQRKVAFAGGFQEGGNNFNEIFSVEFSNPNVYPIQTHVARVTPATGLVACSNTVNGVTTITQRARYIYRDPVPSPDGKLVMAHRTESIPSYDEDDHCAFSPRTALVQFRETGGLQFVLGEGSKVDDAAWQPSTAKVAVQVSDGHDNPLDGLKVELRDMIFPDTIRYTAARTIEGGTYLFEDVSPGEYRLRATLIDQAGQSFEIRHGDGAAEAVWAEREIEVPVDAIQSAFGFPFEDSDAIKSSNVGGIGDATLWHRLDDLAALYYQTHRFVKWVKTNLTAETGPSVTYYAFATRYPPNPFNPLGDPVLPDGGGYSHAPASVRLGVNLSDYSRRDQPGDVAPENGEWHEYAHHVYGLHVATSSDCPSFSTLNNHGGWLNPGTCDSLGEGFAIFLAALAGGNSDYAGWFDLEDHTKAWDNIDLANRTTHEDVAAAGLLWDLVDTGVESEAALVRIGPIFQLDVSYTDAVSLSLAELWGFLTYDRTKTVFALQRGLASQPQFQSLFWDLDGDGTPEVNRADPLFLMHGFFPTARLTDGWIKSNDYRYEYKADLLSPPTNERVGYSSHYVFNSSGGIEYEYEERFNKPLPDTSGFFLRALDASGTPLKNVAVELTIEYPEAETILERTLPTGTGDPVPLRLPPYFNGYLPPGAPLPACNPAEDRLVSATVRGTINGYASLNAPSLDNCLYWHAVLEAQAGDPAFEYVLDFPEDSMPPVTTASIRTLGGERLLGPLIGDYAMAGYWTIELSCDDPVDGGFASGCHRIEYSLDGGPFAPYEDEINLVEQGLYTLEYRSVDAANNEEGIRSRKLGVMNISHWNVSPVTTLTAVASVPPVDGVTTGFWTVTMSCLASNSGTAPGVGCLRTEYSLDGGPFMDYTGAVVVAGSGVHTLSYRSVDILNHQEATRFTTLIVAGPDVTPPVTAIIADSPAPSPFDSNQAMDSWRVRLVYCLDDAYYTPGQPSSGCASTQYSLDGGPFLPLNLGSEVLIEGVGPHTFAYRSTDVVGNQEALNSRPLEIVPSSDQDGDGSIDFADNCPALANSDQLDTDGDGVGNACNDDNDFDGDEWADGYDNCPVDSNSGQEDLDLDGTGDVCDPFPEYTCYYPGWLPPSTDFLAAFQNNTCESWYGVSQPGADLRSAVLAAADLGYASLSGANLSNADLTYASLYAADLSFAVLTGATYNESTIFPSGNTYANAPWGLDGEIAPWNAGMIPLPEPSAGLMLLGGAAGLVALSMRQTTRRTMRRTMRKSRDVNRTL